MRVGLMAVKGLGADTRQRIVRQRSQNPFKNPMAFLTFEDETGIVGTTFFPKAYQCFCHLLNRGRPYLLEGVVEHNWGAATLTVSRVSSLQPDG